MPTRDPETPAVESDRDEGLSARLSGVTDPRALLEGIFRHAPVGFQIYDAAGRSVLTNRAFREMFGSEPPPEYNVLHDEIAERNGVLDLIRRSFSGETITTPPVWYDPRELSQVKVTEGKRAAIVATFFPLRGPGGAVDHVAVVLKDVTAETLAREQAEAERDLLDTIIEQSGDGIIVTDENGALRVLNRVAAEQHGVQREAAPPSSWSKAFAMFDVTGRPVPDDELAIRRALRGESVSGARLMIRTPDGATRLIVGTATPLRRPDGSIAGAVLITRDETERVQAEEELRHDAELRERFSGILGHDLRTPLTSISLGASTLVRSSNTPEEMRAPLGRIVAAAQRMERMIRDLLDLTRARHGGIPINVRDCDLRTIARQVVAEVEAAHPARAIELTVEGDCAGRWDEDRVAQTLSNLVVNAVAYSPRDAVVRVSVLGDVDAVVLRVHNPGEPISAAALDTLFDPFRRASAAPRSPRAGSGLGLGLYIVDQVVRAHGGTVGVLSNAEHGTEFTVRLPRDAPAAAG